MPGKKRRADRSLQGQSFDIAGCQDSLLVADASCARGHLGESFAVGLSPIVAPRTPPAGDTSLVRLRQVPRVRTHRGTKDDIRIIVEVVVYEHICRSSRKIHPFIGILFDYIIVKCVLIGVLEPDAAL